MPARTPEAIIARLKRTVRDVISAPDFVAWVEELGLTPMGQGPAEARAMLAKDLVTWAEVVRRAGARVD
ncbi:tripartite tricarboxylate transporter substrate-binding protein [Elioraea thermophila]|uniref:tripartite tricarboxylate transporter substrate-binding protein n=1 Tax=Elioraea thermophila TaxID=2185104 RepID=UPI001300AAF1